MAQKITQKLGLPPGTPVYIGEPPQVEFAYSCVKYDGTQVTEQECTSYTEVQSFFDPAQTNWITVQGIHNAAEIEGLSKFFNLHPLIVEDILNSEQRPKIDSYDDCIFCVIRLFHLLNDEEGLEPENISLVLGPNFVLVFQERKVDYFGPIRNRLKVTGNRIQTLGGSYLAFVVLDLLIDRFYILLDWLETRILELDEDLFADPDSEALLEIHFLKKGVFEVSRYTRPMLEIVARFIHQESPLINRKTEPFFRDLHDHVMEVVEALDLQKEMLFNLQAQYLALSTAKMNEVMKFLTMMGSVFIPLTFIVGVYGMNFDNMPELRTQNGYFYVLGFMGMLVVGLVGYFKRRKWL